MWGQLDLAECRVGTRRDHDRRLTFGVHLHERNAGRSVGGSQVERDASLAQAGECLIGERVAADRRDQRHVGAQPRAGQRLVGPLAAGDARERGPDHGLPSARQPLDACHQVEVDRADDGDARCHARPAPIAQAASARRSSTVDPSSVSRRSKRPAQSVDGSGPASRRAASSRPCSARTSTASSR